MGQSIGKMLQKMFGNKEMRILMLGLDAAGKTTILYKLKFGEGVKVQNTIPTVGLNMETVTFNKVKFNVWDVGGQDKVRPLWKHYYSGTQGLIFVVDSTDRERIELARQELHHIVSDPEMKDAVLLIFANKSDVPDKMSSEELSERLQLKSLKDRTYNIQGSCALNGDGLVEGLTWLNNSIP